MKQLLLLVFVIGSWNATAQKIRFTDTSNKWTLLYVDNAGWPYVETRVEVNRFLMDTVISGVEYHRLSTPELAVREDTLLGMLYFRFISPNYGDISGTDALEHVLFDYNFIYGDTLKMDYGAIHVRHVVQAIDSVRLGTYSYKRWHMMGLDGVDSYTFIESLGTPYGTTWHVFPLNFEHGYQLRCFSNQGINPYCTPAIELPYGYTSPVWSGPRTVRYFDNDSSCVLQTMPIAVLNPEIATTSIILPNPGGSEIILKMPSAVAKASLSVFDFTGKCVMRKVLGGYTDIPIGQYLSVPGVYYYSLQDAATGRRNTGRFIFR